MFVFLISAADATSHLFFAYLRSLSPDSLRGANGISTLPISLQSLVQATEYPPEAPTLLQVTTTKVVMIVDTVSPTPFSLLRRAKNFEYRDSDHALQQFASYDDPVQALTDECRRVLRSIASTNQSALHDSRSSTNLRDASWSRFEDLGFGESIEEPNGDNEAEGSYFSNSNGPLSLRSASDSRTTDFGRPTTPSWADFLSSGFTDENGARTQSPFLLPPDKVLPPIQTARGQSSQSHKRVFSDELVLDPGELASITSLDLDDSFWWVWITSLSGEEPVGRKAVFGRCALIETSIPGGKWLILEEQVKGAAPEPELGAYIAEKKTFFGFKTRKGKLSRHKSTSKKVHAAEEPYQRPNSTTPMSKTTIGPDQHARIQAAAAALQRKHKEQEEQQQSPRPSRTEESTAAKTNSVMSLQPLVVSEASQAMKWASNYDKNAVRAAYLGDSRAGTGAANEPTENGRSGSKSPGPTSPPKERGPPATPKKEAQDAPSSSTPSKSKPETSKPTQSSPKPARKPVTATPTKTPEQKPAQPAKESKEPSSPDEHKKLKKKPGNTTLKGMFGKKKSEPPLKSTGAETYSPVAAAKAALEGRTAQQSQSAPQTKAPASRRVSAFGSKPAQQPSPAPSKPATPPKREEPKPTQAPEAHTQAAPTNSNDYQGPPQTRKDAEYDALSKIDTNERIQAEREFSSFDHQSPFADQPAFVPEDMPTTPRASTQSRNREKPAEAPTNGHAKRESTASNSSSEYTQDRWAQIRKNAAERAGQPDEPEPRHSQADNKSEDGETSGEESK